MTAADGEDLAADPALSVAEVGDHRGNLFRSEEPGILAEEVLGHPGRGHRRDGIDRDSDLPAFDGKRPREPDQAGLRGAVIGLAEVAEEARGRGRVDDPAVAGGAKVTPGRDGDV